MSATLFLAIAVLLLGIAPFTGRASALLHVAAAVLAGVIIVILLFGGISR